MNPLETFHFIIKTNLSVGVSCQLVFFSIETDSVGVEQRSDTPVFLCGTFDVP